AAAKGATVDTLQGQSITTKSVDGKVFINDAQVIKADIDASNGVIDVINKVILPAAKSADAGAGMRIRRAIHLGAPRFNHGDHGGCAGIDEIAVKSLADDSTIPAKVNSIAAKAMEEARQTHSASKQAWIYRHAMDDALVAM